MASSTEIKKFRLYGEVESDLEPEFVHIEPISARSSLYEWTISPHAHSGIIQLLLVSEGQGVLADGEGELLLPPGTLALVPGGTVHAFRFVPETQGWVLSLAEALLDDPRISAFAQGAILRGNRVRCLTLDQADLADRLLGAMHLRGPGADAATLASLALLLTMAEEAAASQIAAEAPPDRRVALVQRFTSLLEQQFRAHWPVTA